MKKKFVIILLSIVLLGVIFCDEYDLNELNIPEEYLGTYLPVDYLTLLKSYKSHEKAMNETKYQYTVLFLKKDICRSDTEYVDGYAIESNIVDKWKFIHKENYVILDENGFEYQKISDKPFAYTAIANYILKTLFSGYVSNDFKIDDNYLIINNSLYKLHLNPSYTLESIAVSLQNKTPYFIRFTDTKLQLVKGKKIDAMQFDPTDEVIYECNIIK